MNIRKLGLLFSVVITPSLIGCNQRSAHYESTIIGLKTASFEDLVIEGSVKDFKDAGFKYGDLIEISFNRKAGNGLSEKTYTYTAPFITNFSAAGIFNVSICDYEKIGKRISIALGSTEAYDDINAETKDNFLNQKITFKLSKPEGWLKTYEKVGLSQKRTYKYIGRDNYVFTNTRDIKTVGSNLNNSRIASQTFYRMSAPFDDIENQKRYTYSDGILSDIISLKTKSGTTKDDCYIYLINLNYNNFITNDNSINFVTNRKIDGTALAFITLYDSPEYGKATGINTGDNFFSNGNFNRIKKVFLNDDKTGIIDILNAKLKAGSDYCLVLNDDEGIERVGFIYLLLEALAGADYNTLVADYMVSYKNYYNVLNYDDTKEQYEIIKSLTVDRLIYALCVYDSANLQTFNSTDWKNVNVATDYIKNNKIDQKSSFVDEAEKYLSEIGLDNQDILSLKQIICKIAN